MVDLCSTNVKQAVFALSYAETELDFHLSMPHIKDCLGTIGLYVRKAIAFVRRMQEKLNEKMRRDDELERMRR